MSLSNKNDLQQKRPSLTQVNKIHEEILGEFNDKNCFQVNTSLSGVKVKDPHYLLLISLFVSQVNI